MAERTQFQKKMRVMTKLFNSKCTSEKDLQALTMESILKIPGITIEDMTVIIELQKEVKKNTLFSYLGGSVNDTTEKIE